MSAVLALFFLLTGNASAQEILESKNPWREELRPLALGVNLGVPHGLVLELGTKAYRDVWLGFDFGYLPVPIGERTLAILNVDSRAEWYPLSEGWHVGLSAGYQRVMLKGKSLASSFSGGDDGTTSTLSMSNFHVAPYVGYAWEFDAGTRLVLQLGYRVAFLGATDMDHPASSSDSEFPGIIESFAQSVKRPVSRLAVMPLPYFAIRFQIKLN